LVGYLLSDSGLLIYGDLKHPVHASNLSKTLEKIELNHKNPLTIAIDASLGSNSKVGKLIVRSGGIIPAMVTEKNLSYVGDISIVGIVNISSELSGECSLAVLSSTRLWLVMQMAEVIAQGIRIYKEDI